MTIITRLASSQWTRAWRNAFPCLFTTRTIWSSHPTKGPTGESVEKDQWGFEITELQSSNGKTTRNRFDFEIAELLRINQARIIEAGSTVFRNDLSGRLGVACCLGTCSFLLKEPTVSVRFSLTQTLQGEQYQFCRSDSVSLPSHHHFSESHRKFRNAGSGQGQGVMLISHRRTERSHCSSAELRDYLQQCYAIWIEQEC